MAQCISYLNPQHVDCKTMQNHGISLSKSSSDVSQLARFLTDGSRCSQVFPKNPRGRSWFTLDVFLFFYGGREKAWARIVPGVRESSSPPRCFAFIFHTQISKWCWNIYIYLPASNPQTWPSFVGQYSMGLWDGPVCPWEMVANRNGDTRNQLHQTLGSRYN